MNDDDRRDKLFTIGEVAELLSVSKRTVARMLDDGTLPRVRLGERIVRVAAASIAALIERNTAGGPRQ
jgi:excisionase family DNA binding protein